MAHKEEEDESGVGGDVARGVRFRVGMRRRWEEGKVLRWMRGEQERV